MRLQALNQNNWKIAINGSIEGWEVVVVATIHSQRKEMTIPRNIFNDSNRVFTRNIVGSVNVPVSWHESEQWQFNFTPG